MHSDDHHIMMMEIVNVAIDDDDHHIMIKALVAIDCDDGHHIMMMNIVAMTKTIIKL